MNFIIILPPGAASPKLYLAFIFSDCMIFHPCLRATCPTHLTFLDLLCLIIWGVVQVMMLLIQISLLSPEKCWDSIFN
jgi:hypothetical protein